MNKVPKKLLQLAACPAGGLEHISDIAELDLRSQYAKTDEEMLKIQARHDALLLKNIDLEILTLEQANNLLGTLLTPEVKDTILLHVPRILKTALDIAKTEADFATIAQNTHRIPNKLCHNIWELYDKKFVLQLIKQPTTVANCALAAEKARTIEVRKLALERHDKLLVGPIDSIMDEKILDDLLLRVKCEDTLRRLRLQKLVVNYVNKKASEEKILKRLTSATTADDFTILLKESDDPEVQSKVIEQHKKLVLKYDAQSKELKKLLQNPPSYLTGELREIAAQLLTISS